jgi:hypothetical protein
MTTGRMYGLKIDERGGVAAGSTSRGELSKVAALAEQAASPGTKPESFGRALKVSRFGRVESLCLSLDDHPLPLPTLPFARLVYPSPAMSIFRSSLKQSSTVASAFQKSTLVRRRPGFHSSPSISSCPPAFSHAHTLSPLASDTYSPSSLDPTPPFLPSPPG